MPQGMRHGFSQAQPLRQLAPYLLAAVAVAAAFALRTVLAPLLVHRTPFLIFVP